MGTGNQEEVENLREVKCPLGHTFEVSGMIHHYFDSRGEPIENDEEKEDAGKEVSIRTLAKPSRKEISDRYAPKGRMVFLHQPYFVCPTSGLVFREMTNK